MDCVLFRAFAERGHHGGPDSTTESRQGIYAVTPRGDLLASCNSRDPDVVADMLERGLERWAELPAPQKRLDDRTRSALLGAPHPLDAHPPGGLVLDVTSRDLPRSDAPDDWRAHAFNHGQVWFTRDEARKLVSHRTPRAPPYVVPPPIADRLARFHLLDNVRGTAVRFGRRQIERATLTSTVVGIDGDLVSLSLLGTFRARATGRWLIDDFNDEEAKPQERGISLRLRGRATWNRRAERFESFDAIAIGERWGGMQFNQRADDLERSPVGFSLTLSTGEPIPPAFFEAYGW